MDECGRNCGCRGVTRRELLQIGAGAAAVGLAARAGVTLAAEGDFPPSAQTPPPQEWFEALFQRGEPPTYEGRSLKHVAFPLGGIGTGTVWLHGTGRLTAWQIFNNINRTTHVDDTFFAVRIEQEGKPPVVRALQTDPIGPIKGITGVRFTGQYPFAWADFDDPALPARVRLEAYNPLIPLNDHDSAIPCAIFRITVTNAGTVPARISVLASAQNAVNHQGHGASTGVRHPTYGRNVNRIVRKPNMLAVSMRAEPGIPAELAAPMTVFVDHELLSHDEPWPIRNLTVRSVGPRSARPDPGTVYWIARGDLAQMGGGVLTAVTEAVRAGATLILTGSHNPLLNRVEANVAGEATREEETFADFDGPTYGPWKVSGGGFGDAPARGNAPGQSPVTGFLGGGLVNTFNPNDGPQGTLTSPPFTIRMRYITFLIGGGKKPGRCCLNLRIGDRVVRTETGNDAERLERRQWDVEEFIGKEAVLEIVDAESGGWGHLNVDDIRFTNLPMHAVTAAEARAWNEFAPAVFGPLDPKAGKEDRTVEVDRSVPELATVMIDRIRFSAAPGRRPDSAVDGTRTLLAFQDGAPALLAAERGKGKVFIVPADIVGLNEADATRQRDAAVSLLAGLAGIGFQPAAGRPETAPSFGTMCLATPDTNASCRVAWREREALLREFTETATFAASSEQDGPTEAGTTINAALVASAAVAPNGSINADFVLTWHFPNHYYPQNAWRAGRHNGVLVGNMYTNWYHDAVSVAAYVIAEQARLRDQTEGFRRCLYDSSLPHYFVDCVGANASILRSPTCFWTKDNTFYGFEGCSADGGCCPMNCNHVWNYEHTLSKLWPSLERNMRITELVFHQRPDGGCHHRVEVPRTNPNKTQFPVADGQCGAVLKAYREHLQSPDNSFLARHWPRIKKAMEFAISNWDSDRDGVMDKPQFNTYDREIFGLNTFVSSLYLAALRAAEEMARRSNDTAAARQYRDLFERGSKFIREKLFNGEYYIQIADNLTGGYGNGCFSDQVVGQWWARVLNLGDILPAEQVRSALASIYRYAWLTTQKGFHGTQRFRQFADGDDKALLICAWPKGGRPADPIYYRDEAWTGVEYQVAAHKIYEGQIREALAIVKGARERYDGTKRNPWNEIECGDYYARAMSSWTLLLAAQGYAYDGPAGALSFNPRLNADDHSSFFSTAEGWGRFTQKRNGRRQENRLAVACGRCELSRLALGLPEGAANAVARVKTATHEYSPSVAVRDGMAVLTFTAPVVVSADETLDVVIEWT